MPKLSLSGGVYGKTGTAVSLAQSTDTGTLAAPALGWNVARGNIAVTISEAPTHLPKYAPYFCEFDIVADGVTDQMVSVDAWNKRYQSIFFKTTFGDPGTLHKTTKILEQHRDRNVSFTPGKPGHVYEAPGTYTVTSDLCDLSGNTGSATHTVTVIDPEDPVLGYPSNRTIVVDTAGNFTGAPRSDAINKVTTWEAATVRAKAIYDSTSNAHVRIMLRGGQTFAHTDASVGSSLRDSDSIWIGRWGSALPAQINFLGLTTDAGSIFNGVGAGQMKATDIITQGPWDEEAEIWTAYDRGLFFSQKHAYEVLCHNVTFKGTNTCVSPSSVSEGTAPVTGTGKVFMSNVVADGNKDFICLATGKGYGVHFLGCETIKSPTAHNGAEDRWKTNIPGTVGEPNGLAALDDRNRYPRHAHQGYRGGGVRFCEFDGCAMTQTHGWTGGAFSDNACMRVDTSASKDQNIYISRCKILGSVNYADASGTTAVKSPSTNALFQMCVFSQNPTLGNMIYLEGSGFTIRSCLLLAPPTKSGGSLREFVNLTDGVGWDAFSNLYPNVLNGNTEVITVGAAQIGFYTPMDDPAKHPLKPIKRIKDNICLCPGLAIDDGPWRTRDSGKRFAYPGVSRGWEQLSTTLSASVASGATVTFPYWNDWFGAPLTQASFAGQDNRHAITVGSTHHNYTVAGVDRAEVTVPQNLSVAFGPTGVTVTNLSGVTWASGAAVKLWVSRGKTGMVKDTAYAYDAPLILRAPAVGSPSYQTADPATIWPVDLLGNYRPGTRHPLSPAGLPSKGAVEPASLA